MERRWTLTETDLRSVPDGKLVQKVVDAVLDYVGQLGPGEDDYEVVRQTPKTAQFFWAMRLLESEVNNGGFEQYFWNSSCTLADVAREAYEAIGAEGYLDLLRKAWTVAGDKPWRTRRGEFDNNWRSYKKTCPSALDALDNEFYAAKGGSPDSGGTDEDLYRLKVEYIRQNARKICAP